VPYLGIEQVLGGEGVAAAEAAGHTWARVWGRVPLVGGRSFRDLFEWRGTSLLWTAEAFLREATAGPRCARTADLWLRLLEAMRPPEVDALGLESADRLLLARACTVAGVLLHDAPSAAPAFRLRWRARWGRGLSRMLRSLRAPFVPPPSHGDAPVLALFSASDDRAAVREIQERVEGGLGTRVLTASLEDVVDAASRRARAAAAGAKAALRARFRDLSTTPGLRASYAHRGVSFADLVVDDLEALVLGHLPDVAELLEAAFERLEASRPSAVLAVTRDRDEERCLVLAAGAADVPVVAARPEPDDHHAADRADGGPRPVAVVPLQPVAEVVEALARLPEVARGRVGAG
jgi:hypothetical protein